MNNTIPKAEEFLYSFDHNNLPLIMIEFAKLHVEAALKEVSENIENHYDLEIKPCYKDLGGVVLGHQALLIPSKDSILNAYPLTNIK